MKYRAWRYILVIYICAVVGASSAFMTGPSGIFRGAMLGVCLAAAFPVIDYLKSKGKCASVWAAAFVGASFGLLCGLIICQTKVNDYNEGLFPALDQPLLLIAVSTLYGFLTHLSLAIKNRWQIPAYFAAMFFCQYCRFAFSNGYSSGSLILALMFFMPFALLWYAPVACLLIPPWITSTYNSSNQQGEKVS